MELKSPMLTVDEVASLLHVHRITVYRLLEQGKIRGLRIGRIWRFDPNEIDALMQRRQVAGPT